MKTGATQANREILGINNYIFCHGHKPKGKGTWAFFSSEGTMFTFNGTFTEAKKKALNTIKGSVTLGA